MTSKWINAGAVAALTPGNYKVVDLQDCSVILANVAGDYLAVEDRCTHDESPLEGGELVGAEFICPRHGARFCLRTGKALCAPAYEPIAVHPVKVENGQVFVGNDPN